MFWQNRAEAVSAKQEKVNTKAVNEEKFEKGQQTVTQWRILYKSFSSA